ncbi:MAG: hypothetical protein ABIA63_00065, partial [bacterium]
CDCAPVLSFCSTKTCRLPAYFSSKIFIPYGITVKNFNKTGENYRKKLGLERFIPAHAEK